MTPNPTKPRARVKAVKAMTDEEHMARLKELAVVLNKAADEARKTGLVVELIPNGEDEPIRPRAIRYYE